MFLQHIVRSLVLALTLTVAFFIAFEWYWRQQGFWPSFNDDKVLWADKRKQIYLPSSEATVFVGGSRIKFSLDIPTWEKLTGERAIQLAIVGTSGRSVLLHLANDKNFRGKLVLDVAEGQFFSFTDSLSRDKAAREAIEYFKEETPAQRMSSNINFFLESQLVSLEEGKFSTTALLNDLNLKNRPGINVRPPFPKGFGISGFDRQTSMAPMFLSDTAQINQQKRLWRRVIRSGIVIKGDTLAAFLNQVKNSIEKIRARGGTVAFVRPPSNGDYVEQENLRYPRAKYWDRLLQFTNTPGIHFTDNAATAMLTCPETSHLTKDGAVQYTTGMVTALRQQLGWKFKSDDFKEH